jgi:hypothetical protein
LQSGFQAAPTTPDPFSEEVFLAWSTRVAGQHPKVSPINIELSPALLAAVNNFAARVYSVQVQTEKEKGGGGGERNKEKGFFKLIFIPFIRRKMSRFK